MRRQSHSSARRVWFTLAGAAALMVFGWTAAVRTQGAQAPAAAPTAGGAAQGAGAPAAGGRGGGRGTVDNGLSDFGPRSPYLPRTPEEEAKGFRLPPGYRLEIVASDPDLISPGAIEFDGNGRMYVAELVGYMMDAEATREHDPVSRISRWESTRGDGKYDKHTIFADKLVAPRMILALTDGAILTSETDSDDIIKLTDTNGDGVADRREVVYTGIGQSGDANIEHQKAGLVWNMDNWIYTTYNAFRIRWTPSGFQREATGPNGGQWGLGTDDDGKPWFVDAGGERGPMNFQFPIHYGAFTPCAGGGRGGGGRGAAPGAAAPGAAAPGAAPAAPAPAPAPPARDPNCPANFEGGFEPDFATVWPAPGISDMQGGLGRIRMPAGNLNHFTASTGPAIVRGDRVPADLKSDFLFTEPVGRLIRRAKIENIEGLTLLHNAYPAAEFITSEDQLFRPVNIHNAPDGTVYIVDMYHGIIQERQWSGPGTYLRAKIEQYQLDKVAAYGRIWRLRYDGRPAVAETATNRGQPAIPAIEPDFALPRMYSQTPAQIVAHLNHANGWYRDMAQRQLILKQDKSVVPAVQQLARASNTNLVGRFNALWTLEGLGSLDAAFVREEMKDTNPRMRIQALRASETLYKAGNKTFAEDYKALAMDKDPNVSIQAMLTLNLFKVAGTTDVVKAAQAANPVKGVMIVGNWVATAPAIGGGGGRGGGGGGLTPEQQQRMQQGGEVFSAVCFSCHGTDGRGQPLAGAPDGTMMAPPLAGSPRVTGHRDYIIKVLLNGISGPLGDKTYSEVMVPQAANKDEWIAGVASYVRSSFGNNAGQVSPADVARVRAETSKRKTQWTLTELEATLPRLVETTQMSLTASHNTEQAANANGLRGWNSGTAQVPGMWFQVELAQPAVVSEVIFDSAGGGRGGGGGGRGAAGAPGAPGAAAGRGAAGAPAAGAPATAAPAPGAQAAAPAAGGVGAAAGGRGAFGGGAGGPAPAGAYPRGYSVTVSTDGKTWSKPVATGKGTGTRTDIVLTPTRAKYVRVTQTDTVTETPAPNWSITNLRVYEAPAAK